MTEATSPSGIPLSRLYLSKLDSPPTTILEHLIARFPRVPARIWRRRLSDGCVTSDDGGVIGPDAPYRHGVTVLYRKEIHGEPAPKDKETILSWDGHILVADKPHGMVVTPTGVHLARSLLVRLQRSTGLATLVPIHRLDQATAGLVLFSVQPEERKNYHQLFAEGSIRREYLAVAHLPHIPDDERWRVEDRIGPGKPWYRQRMVSGTSNAITDIEFIHAYKDEGLFRIRPRTGKKHQIRVHMASIGFPIVGDTLYPEVQGKRDLGPPLQLLASRLAFIDPNTGVRRDFRSGRHLTRLRTGARTGTTVGSLQY